MLCYKKFDAYSNFWINSRNVSIQRVVITAFLSCWSCLIEGYGIWLWYWFNNLCLSLWESDKKSYWVGQNKQLRSSWVVLDTRLELATFWLRINCSTYWANPAKTKILSGIALLCSCAILAKCLFLVKDFINRPAKQSVPSNSS